MKIPHTEPFWKVGDEVEVRQNFHIWASARIIGFQTDGVAIQYLNGDVDTARFDDVGEAA